MRTRKKRGRVRHSQNKVSAIVDHLRRLRVKRLISMEELSQKIGYDRTSLHDWENGHRQPKFQAVVDWADALGLVVTLECGH
jgi:transcriptional regulator with XRE-family HTH domain